MEKNAHWTEVIQCLASNPREELEAWEVVYKRFSPWVFATAYRALKGDREEAEDVTQIVFMRLVQYSPFDRIQTEEALKAYLRRMVLNVMRSKGAKHSPGYLMVVVDDLPQQGGGSHARLAELRETLKLVVKDLTHEERELLRQRFEGLTLKEASIALDASPGALAVRWYRLRRKLLCHPLLGAETSREPPVETEPE